jgi:hypothetical protein
MDGEKKVNRYRSGTKNPDQEVLVYTDGQGNTKVHVVDFQKGKVTTLSKKEGAPG